MSNQGRPCKEERSKVLLVEGLNDCHVIMALCGQHQVPHTFGIYECGGDKDRILKRLNALIQSATPPEAIGVVVDADTGIERRWTSIKAKLLKNYPDYKFPDLPNQDGTIVPGTEPLPVLGFWLMPNNQTEGMLEDFCLEMVEPQAYQVAKDSVENAQVKGVATFIQAHFSKAIVHTYLAWQDEPGRPLGQSITDQALRPNTKTAISFTEWLKRLFS